MSFLNVVYLVLGAVFAVLGVAALLEKYRTVRGAALLPARITGCEKEGPKNHKSTGGYRFQVEFNDANGVLRKASTNDAFWFSQEKKTGHIIEIWYNPATPEVVERKSWGTEAIGIFFVLLGVFVVLWLGLELF